MKKNIFIIVCTLFIIVLLTGCSTQEVSKNMLNNGFEIIDSNSNLDKDIENWAKEKQSSTGIYKKKSPSGNYILISLGNHKQYSVRKIDVQKDNYGYLFNVEVDESREDSKEQGALLSPILVRTENTSDNYDIKIIYH